MIRSAFSALFVGTLLGASSVLHAETVTSPDGHLVADVTVSGTRLTYTLVSGATTVIESSPLGFIMNGTDRGDQVTIASVTEQEGDESFPSRHGMHATARGHYKAKLFTITHAPTGSSYVLNVRAYDSGVAFRYEVTQSGAKNITGESTAFSLPAGTRVWSQAGNGVYENIYGGSDISAIATGSIMGPPVVGRLPGGSGYVALTEAAPGAGFPNPYLTKAAGRRLQVAYPKNGDNTYGASTGGNAYSPWNVITTGTLDTLVNSDIVESLAPAPDPALFPQGAATAWAAPGRSVWDWMSRFPGGITAENSKLESYWASQLGWEFNTIDEGWANWNGDNPWPQVKEVTDYSTPLGVKILVWVRSENIQTQSQRTAFFTKLKENGVSGFKADFFDFSSVSPAAKERVALVEAILKEAAGYQLVADLHGVAKPMGQFRTYPNVLNFEAVYGKESFPNAVTSSYVPLTRLLAGPADYTPLGLQGNLQGDQTQAFEIATIVNMAGPLITIAERGDRVAISPFAPVIKSIPCLWDETKVLAGTEVGESCAMARRKGDAWFVGIMNSGTARSWPLALSFLTPGLTYQAEIIRDGSTAMEYRTVTSADFLSVATSASGGFVARFSLPSGQGINGLPFSTTFNTGRGSIFADKGEVLPSNPWASTLLEDQMPRLLWPVASSGTTLAVVLDDTDAYQGGASLKVSGTLDAPNDLPLYAANIAVTADTRLSIAFKRGVAGVESGVQAGLTFADSPGAPVFVDVGLSPTAGWNQMELNLSAYAGRQLTAVALRFAAATPVTGYTASIGRLALYEAPLAAVPSPGNFRAEGVQISGLDTVSATLKWDAPSSPVRYYNIFQKNPDDGKRRWLGVSSGASLAVQGVRPLGGELSIVFQVEAMSAAGVASARREVSVALPNRPLLTNPLNGTVIGTAGSYENRGNTRDKVYDGDSTTYFDAPAADGVWAGIDLGVAGGSKVTAIQYFPRDSWSGRMAGGVFQGANQSNFNDAVTLATVANAPDEGAYTLVAVTHGGSFRYLRYLSPNGGWGNVAEVKFYGPGKPAAPSGLKAGRNHTSAVLEWLPLSSGGTYQVKRSNIPGGPYQVVAQGLTAPAFTDTGLSAEESYYYVVSAFITDVGEGADSGEVEAIDLFASWATASGLPAGTDFIGDANANGIADGLEYAVPAGLRVDSGVPGNAAFSAVVRDDRFLNLALMRSVDLSVWAEIPADEEVDQNGVASGYFRISFHDAQAPAADRQFYRLQVSR